MAVPIERDVDALFARLDYLKRVRQARLDAEKQLAAAGHVFTADQVERLLNGGAP